MSKRLIEVANELKVSTKIIVEHLRQNGFEEVNEKPTSKLSNEMYDVLVKHFSSAIAIKEQAEQLSTNSSTQRKKEDRSKDKLRPWERPTLANKEPKSLMKDATSEQKEESKTSPEDKNAIATSPKVETNNEDAASVDSSTHPKSATITGPKILGKVDLDAINNRSTTNQGKEQNRSKDNNREQTKDKQNKKQERNNNNNKEQRNTNERRSNSSNHTNNNEGKQLLHTPKSQLHKSEEQVEKHTSEKEELAKNLDQSVSTPTEQQMPDLLSPDQDSLVDNSYRAETPQLQGLKILGKINLDKPKPANNQNKNNNNRNKSNKDNQARSQSNEGKNNDRNRQNNGDNDRNRQNNAKQNNNATNATAPATTPATPTTPKPLLHTPKGATSNNADGDKRKRIGGTPTTPGAAKPKEAVSNEKPGDKKGGKLTGRGGKKEISERELEGLAKANMARVQSGQKRKKIGTTRAERAEKKEQTRLKAEENQEVAPIQVTEFISVSELASLMDVSSTDVITTCMSLGIFVSINQRLDSEVIELVASEFGFAVEFISAEQQMDLEEQDEVDAEEDLSPRSPIVAVMGHVDHGKTSLLDYIRKANVASGEAGGITQHIGAYEVNVGEKGKITFLDTPGHEAFTAMRARGAQVTDIAVIIVAADDNVMPQTKEAISHAHAANVPIVFAINKVDKEAANPEKIKQELASMNYLVEDWGGKYQSQEISAKKGMNVDLLLEKILLEAEMLDLKANPKRKAIGTVLEASLEKGRGYVAKILVQTGTLKIGDPIVAGQYSGKVKAMFNERGKNVKVAGPSTPVLVLGLDGAPQAGEKIKVMASERDAKELASKRAQLARQQQIRATKRITLDDITRRLQVGNFQELNLIVKADMDGSMEALSDSLIKLATDQIQTRIVHKAVGPITESDVNLALASDAIIVGFQVRPNATAKKLAEQEGVQIKTYSIIYDAINEVKSALEGMLQPKQVEKEVGSVEIREVFKITKIGTVAGCFVTEGKITRNSLIRVIRGGIVVYPTKENAQGELGSLKRFKDSVSEVKSGFECGLTIKNFDAIQEGDVIEAYEIVEVKQKLDDLKMTNL